MRGRLPVVCGGTNYYVQSLLLKSSLLTSDEQSDEETHSDEIRTMLEQRDSAELYYELQKVDPAMAAKLHENDKRKIVRALQVFREKGKPLSQVLAQQAADGLGTFQPSNMRYDACVFCTVAPRELLTARIDARVEEMFKAGLLDEIRDFHLKIPDISQFNNQGLLQSIGFKEFLPHLRGDMPLEACKQSVQLRTRRYAIRQLQWITRQFVGRGLPVLRVDSPWLVDDKEALVRQVVSAVQEYLSVAPSWYDLFYSNAFEFSSKEYSQIQVWRSEQVVSRPETTLKWKKFHCELCDVTVNGENEWSQHQGSFRHRREAHRSRRRKEAFEPSESSTVSEHHSST